ncbi:hypothetical protein NDU88_001675 [Pleurodeles waltl]|uniref:Uncharacterized protein n=1 Tax=Pleurodeles waltl TaxID=8319 RepID=A0AAV7W0N8_PLEWA|nr:hypothetical protein NDU88_001675 [Pleurodeles waltl]
MSRVQFEEAGNVKVEAEPAAQTYRLAKYKSRFVLLAAPVAAVYLLPSCFRQSLTLAGLSYLHSALRYSPFCVIFLDHVMGHFQSGTYEAPAPPQGTSYVAPARAREPRAQLCSPEPRPGPVRLAPVGPGGLGPCPLPCLQLGFVLWGGAPLRPHALVRYPGVLTPAGGLRRGRRHTRATRSDPRAACRFTQGRGFPREDGPQASSRVGRPASVPRSPLSHGKGSVAPATRQQSVARALARNSPGWRALQDFCRRPLGSSGIKRSP